MVDYLKAILFIMCGCVAAFFVSFTVSFDSVADEDIEQVVINSEEISNEVVIEETITHEDVEEQIRQRAVAEINSLDDSDKLEFFKQYKELEQKYANYIDKAESIYDVFSNEELNTLFSCVETETHGCDFESKVNVAAVIYNRLDNGEFPDDILDIITSKKQFAYGRDDIDESTILACEYAYQFPTDADNALFFHSNEKTNTFNGREYIMSDSSHHFYGGEK